MLLVKKYYHICKEKAMEKSKCCQVDPEKDGCIWEYDGKTIEECHEAFLGAPIFDGKTFWDAEQDIEWVDD